MKDPEAKPSALDQDPNLLSSVLLRDQMPGIKSQGQYDAVVGAMEALRMSLNAILEQDSGGETKAQKALEMALDATRKATEITGKLREVPEAADSEAAKSFTSPPAQFEEYQIQRKLMKELDSLETLDDLNAWYALTKEQRDRIVTQALRNTLLDSIRSKKNSLQA